MEFQTGFITDIGLKRQKNQDNGGVFPEMGLFVVADGMGGHRGGETASSMVMECLPPFIQEKRKDSGLSSDELMRAAIEEASDAIFQKASEVPELEGMGTTTTALYFHDGQVSVGHVGDSRCYYIRPGAIWQLTRDHSLVQEKLRAGLITRDQLKTDRLKNVITRSVGFEDAVEVDLYRMPVQAGDLFLVCSDGLSGPVEDHEILETVEKDFFEGNHMQMTVEHLVQMANDRGGDDNVTILMVQVKEI